MERQARVHTAALERQAEAHRAAFLDQENRWREIFQQLGQAEESSADMLDDTGAHWIYERKGDDGSISLA